MERVYKTLFKEKSKTSRWIYLEIQKRHGKRRYDIKRRENIICLVSIAPKGTKKDSPLLYNSIRNGFRCNSQGSGYAIKYSKTGLIYISKGYWKAERLISSLKERKMTDDDELIIHNRIPTSGDKNTANCHPFVIGQTQEEVIQDEGYVKYPVLAHNGVFGKYSEWQSAFSDTYHFTKQFMSIPEVLSLLKRDKVTFEAVFKETLGYNKVVFLFPDRDLETVGQFITDEGYMYSNTGYKDPFVRNVGGEETNCNVPYSRYPATRTHSHDAANNFLRNGRKVWPEYEEVDDETGAMVLLKREKNQVDIKVTKLNVRELVFKCTSSLIPALEDGIIYQLDPDYDFETKHVFVNDVEKKHYRKYVKMVDMLSSCIILPGEGFEKKYASYMTLKYKYPASKNAIKKLGKILSRSYGKAVIKIKEYGELDRDGVSVYYEEVIAPLKEFKQADREDSMANYYLGENGMWD